MRPTMISQISRLMSDMSVPFLLHGTDDVLPELLPIRRYLPGAMRKPSKFLSRDHVMPSTMVSYASTALDNRAVDRRHEVRDIWNDSWAHPKSYLAWFRAFFIALTVDVDPAMARHFALAFGFAAACFFIICTLAS